MNRNLRRRLAAATVATTVLAGAVVANSLIASGSEDEPVRINRGYIEIDYSATGANNGAGAVTYHDPKLAEPVVQQIVVAECAFSTSGPELLTFVPTGGTVTSHTGSSTIGVNSAASCGLQGSRISPGQVLTIALGGYFDGADVVINNAELNVISTTGSKLLVTLDPGSDGATALPAMSVGSGNAAFGGGTGTVFRSVALGSQGGANPPPQRGVGLLGGSVLNLVSAEAYAAAVGCGDDLAPTGSEPGTSADDANFSRDLNIGTEDCDDIGASLEILDEGVWLNKSTDGVNGLEENVSATIEIVWAPQPAELPLPVREINFSGDPDDEDGFVDAQWCIEYDVVNDVWVHPAETPWCLIHELNELLPDGTVQQTQVYHGSGDPFWK